METPSNVSAYAINKLGVEPACLDAGPKESCAKCFDLMLIAFDHFYGEIPHDQVTLAIQADILRDEAGE